MADIIEEIHDFWFGELDGNGLCTTDRSALWFGADKQADETCRVRFGASLAQARARKLDDWAQTDRGLIALVVVLDQFSRNIHRGTPEAFAADALALSFSRDSIARGRHLHLPAIHQVFLYLPLEHCEDVAAQDWCVTLLEDLEKITGQPQFASFTRYARAHRDVIARFGRFPHRNAILGRQSSAEEQAYLEQHGGF